MPRERPRPVLIRTEGERKTIADPARPARGVLVTLGGAVALVGLLELALLWFPPSFGVAAWEFGTINQTSRVVPIAGLGLALLVYGIARDPNASAGVVRAASLAFVALAALFALGAVVYARAVPAVLSAAPAHALGPLYSSIIQTGASVIVSVVSCLLIARLLWRGIRPR